MEAFLRSWFPIALLLALLDSVSTQEPELKYFTSGGSIKLRPSDFGNIKNVLWKHNGNLVADWSPNELELFGKFRGRTDLDNKTGTLVIERMMIEDQGKYTVRINLDTNAEEAFVVKMVRRLHKPRAVLRPLTCSKQSVDCTLFCEEDNGADATDTGPITYTFMGDDKLIEKKLTGNINVRKENTAEYKKLSCQMKNPVNEQQSDVIDNVFYEPAPSPIPKIVAGVVSVVVVAVVAAVVGYWKRHSIISYITKKRDGTNRLPTSNSNGNAQADPAREAVLLNQPKDGP